MNRSTFFGLAVLATGACACVTAATAADLNKYNPYSGRENGHTLWDSYYGGFNIGFGFDEEKVKVLPADATGAASLAAGTFPRLLTVANDGVVLGAQVGVNTRFSEWVYGVEWDVDYSSLSGSSSPAALKVERSINWLSTLRGRVGLLVTPKTLVYGTAGFAFAETELSARFAGIATGQKTDTKTTGGFAFGSGFEHIIHDGMSFKAEYIYVDLGTHTLNLDTAANGALNVSVKNSANLLRAGINYKF